GVAPTIIEAELSMAMLSWMVAPKPITVVVEALTVWVELDPVQIIGTTDAMAQGAGVDVLIVTVSIASVVLPDVQSFCTGAQTWKLVIAALVLLSSFCSTVSA